MRSPRECPILGKAPGVGRKERVLLKPTHPLHLQQQCGRTPPFVCSVRETGSRLVELANHAAQWPRIRIPTDWSVFVRVDSTLVAPTGAVSTGIGAMDVSAIHYLEGVRWKPLPVWAVFLARLGSAQQPDATATIRTTTAILLPTRDYAVPLIAAGLVAARARTAVHGGDIDAHFAALSLLPPGTEVILTVGNRKRRGICLGCKVQAGRPLVGVQIQHDQTGGDTRWLPKEQCLRVEVRGASRRPLPKRQSGSRIEPPSALLCGLLGVAAAVAFVQNSSLDCLLIGPERALREEISALQIALAPAFSPATLQDLLRVYRMPGNNEVFHTALASAACGAGQGLPGNTRPPVVLFDGAASYLRWHDQWPDADWIVVLDRTSPTTDAAVAQLNQDYMHRIENIPVSVLEQFPTGIEVRMHTRFGGSAA